MIIKVLGPGCTNCKNLERVTREAVADLGLDATIEKVEDYAEIAGYGIMSTPALVVDERSSSTDVSPRSPSCAPCSQPPPHSRRSAAGPTWAAQPCRGCRTGREPGPVSAIPAPAGARAVCANTLRRRSVTTPQPPRRRWR